VRCADVDAGNRREVVRVELINENMRGCIGRRRSGSKTGADDVLHT
jgi:hypothetical protein